MLYALLSSVFYAVQNMACKEHGKRFPQKVHGLLLTVFLAMVVQCAAMAAVGGAVAIGRTPLLLAAGFGLTFAATFTCMTSAMAIGPLGMSALIGNCSLMFTTCIGIACWGEQMTVLKGVGTLCILVMLVLSGLSTRGGKKGGVKWLTLALCSLGGNVLLSVFQHEVLAYPEVSANAFNFWSSVFSALFALAALLVLKLRGADFSQWLQKKKELALIALGMGVGTAGGNAFAIIVLEHLEAVVAFPLRQGSLVLIMWLIGRLIYHDEKGRWDPLLLISGLAGIVLMNL